MKNLINILLILLISVTSVAQTRLDYLVFDEINNVRNEKLSHKNYDKRWYNNSIEDTIYYNVSFDTSHYESVLSHNKYMYNELVTKGTIKNPHTEYINGDTITHHKRYNNIHSSEIILLAPYYTFIEDSTDIKTKAKRFVDDFVSSKEHKKILMNKEYKNICVSTYVIKGELNLYYTFITIMFY